MSRPCGHSRPALRLSVTLVAAALILPACTADTAGDETHMAQASGTTTEGAPGELMQDETQLILNALGVVVKNAFLSPPGAARLYAYTLTAAEASRQAGGSAVVAADVVLDGLLDREAISRLTPLGGVAARVRARSPEAAEISVATAERHLAAAAADGALEQTSQVPPESTEARPIPDSVTESIRADIGIGETGLRIGEDVYTQIGERTTLDRILESDELFTWATTPVLHAKETPRWGDILPIGVDSVALDTCANVPPDRRQVLDEAFELLDDYNIVDASSPSVAIWLGGRGTITPAGMWIEMAAEAAHDQGMDMLKIAAAVARATHNASIVNYREKYRHNLVRPETLWERLFEGAPGAVRDTPPHPSYPSGHSVISSAAAATIEQLLGSDVPLTLNVPGTLGWPDQAVTYTSPAEALASVSNSRIIAGFHYPMDTAAGEMLGACVAQATLADDDLAGADG